LADPLLDINLQRIRARGGSDVEQEVKYALSRGRDHARSPMQVSRLCNVVASSAELNQGV
jgi:hypothetical protein